jgi:outer membrane protein assembly factor BamB
MKTATGVCWYVNSRGVPREKDYRWLADGPEDGDHLRGLREHLSGRGLLGGLMNDEWPGLALVHDARLGMMVYLTRLVPRGAPRDSLNRPIRAALLGNSRHADGCQQLIAIAVAALTGILDGELPLNFDCPTESGFTLDEGEWRDLVSGCLVRLDLASAAPGIVTTCDKLRNDDEISRLDTAAELVALEREDRVADLAGRIIVLRVPVMTAAEKDELAPWRVLTELTSDRAPEWTRRRAPRIRLPKAVYAIGLGGGVAAGAIAGIVSLLASPPARPPAARPPSARQLFTWTYHAGTAVQSVQAADGTVYLSTAAGAVEVLNASTGHLRWRFQAAPAAFALANGTVYLSTATGTVEALRAGRLLWTDTVAPAKSAPLVANGMVYLATADGTIYALNPRTGGPIWSQATGSAIQSAPVTADGDIYVTTVDGTIYAFNASTGSQIWTARTGLPGPSTPVVERGVIYVSTADGDVYARNAAHGKDRWGDRGKAALAGPSAPVVAGGVVYVSTAGGTVYAVDAGKGRLIWTYPGLAGPSAPVVAGGVVYVSTAGGTVYAVDAATGKRVWVRDVGQAIPSAPAAADGGVFFGCDDGTVYAVGAATAR